MKYHPQSGALKNMAFCRMHLAARSWFLMGTIKPRWRPYTRDLWGYRRERLRRKSAHSAALRGIWFALFGAIFVFPRLVVVIVPLLLINFVAIWRDRS